MDIDNSSNKSTSKSIVSPAISSSSEKNNNSASPIARKETKMETQKLHMKQRGRIELIMGPMFAGKSTELLRRVNRLEISGKKCLSVKFAADNRYS